MERPRKLISIEEYAAITGTPLEDVREMCEGLETAEDISLHLGTVLDEDTFPGPDDEEDE